MYYCLQCGGTPDRLKTRTRSPQEPREGGHTPRSLALTLPAS